MKTILKCCWFGVLIFATVLLDESPMLSSNLFLRMMEVNLIMVGSVSFIYGFGRGYLAAFRR